MGRITFRHEPESELEKALGGIQFSESVWFGYGCARNKKAESPAYILPVVTNKDVIHGRFTIDGKLTEVAIGFVQRTEFLHARYYTLNRSGGVEEHRHKDDVLYFPLKLTGLEFEASIEKEGKTVVFTYPVYGLEGPYGLHPVILIAENEKSTMQIGFYKNRAGSPASYNITASGTQIRGLLSRSKPAGQSSTLRQPDNIARKGINWESPKSIVSYLDQYIIGQDEAKKCVAVAFCDYMLFVRNQGKGMRKENLLLVGPTGVGKTYMVSLLAENACLPFLQTKVTGKSSEGYVGDNLSSVLGQMRAKTTSEIPFGVVFFDEIDKLARDEHGVNGFGEKLQSELIGWVEEATVQTGKDRKYALNTRNILFVAAGAFYGGGTNSSLESIIRRRLGIGQRRLGFLSDGACEDSYALSRVEPRDLIAYGLMPELVSRLPFTAVFRPLTVEDKVRILTEAKRSVITSITEMLRLRGYELLIAPGTPEKIALLCPEETGARGLDAICHRLFTDIMFDPGNFADGNNVIRVTPDLVCEL
ncbi:AAA family ATPase [Candidatus Woesearchaeota archaeon]|nr:AAA family ATPase [Candidatus Woesearchaeota archaeon]